MLDQLPPKITNIQRVQMGVYQHAVYDNIIRAHTERRTMRASNEKYDALDEALGKGKTIDKSDSSEQLVSAVDGDDESASIVRSLNASEARNIFTALRKAANHPLLLRNKYTSEEILKRMTDTAIVFEHFGNKIKDFERVKAELMKFNDYDLHLLCLMYKSYLGDLVLANETLYDSPKLCWMRDHLPEMIQQGHRVLIFSQWQMILDLLGVFLNDMEINFLRLDGNTKVSERQEMVDKFQTPAPKGQQHEVPVFILSTKAGGLGVNLTAADTVILHDLDFNPENDRQAEDRSHRIGQTREVRVFKLVTSSTVDEDIFEMGAKKSLMTEAVLNDKGKNSDDIGEVGAIGRILQNAIQRYKTPT